MVEIVKVRDHQHVHDLFRRCIELSRVEVLEESEVRDAAHNVRADLEEDIKRSVLLVLDDDLAFSRLLHGHAEHRLRERTIQQP